MDALEFLKERKRMCQTFDECEKCSSKSVCGKETDEMNKYSWSFDGDAELWSNSADSVEDCIFQANTENGYDGYEHETVYIGENAPFVPTVDAESVLDQMQEDAGEFAGEIGNEWYAYSYEKMDEIAELNDALTKVVHDWMRKYGYYPYFFRVDNIKPYPLKTAMSGEKV